MQESLGAFPRKKSIKASVGINTPQPCPLHSHYIATHHKLTEKVSQETCSLLPTVF